MRKQSSIVLGAVAFACAALVSTAAIAQTARQKRNGQRVTRPAAPAPAAPTPDTGVIETAGSTLEANCGCEAGGAVPVVLAVVNGTRITSRDFSEQTRQRVLQIQQQVIIARRSELDLQINAMLLEAEAKKRGISTSRLIETEVVSKVQPVTDAEAQAFYDRNKASISGEFSVIRANIFDYLTDERQRAGVHQLADQLRATTPVKVLVQNATPPATPADRARLLATIGDRRITSGDIEDSLRALIFNVQEQVYKLRRDEVELKINDILLNAEAQKRNLTMQALLDAEVASKVSTVTEADARKFYDENSNRINGDFTQLKPQIIQYLQGREANRVESQFAERLRRAAAAVNTFLTPPEPPVYDIATDDQPVKGNTAATVTVIEFTDFQCPSCKNAHPVISRLAAEYADRIKLVVRDFPLRQHADAFKAAEAAEAAREQGKYWEYIALLFDNQTALEVDKLKAYATQVGLDRQKFDAALDSGRFADQVRRDISDGTRAGVDATPTFYVNGRKAADISYESLKASIEAALKASARD